MKDITKQNFRYCLAESQGRGCLCAAMFHLRCDTNNTLVLNFKADDTSYGDKTRNAWLVNYPGETEMSSFYLFHKKTFEFLEKTFPNESWYAKYYHYDDENLLCKLHDIPNRQIPDQTNPEFWKKQFEITKKMWEHGYINGNYPQGHYMLNQHSLILVVSYFGTESNVFFTDEQIKSFNSCHKIQTDNKKKNWFIKHYVRDINAMKQLSTDDFWRLTLASQYGQSIPGFNNYIITTLDMVGKSKRQDINEYISACLNENTKNYEIEYVDFNNTLND
jgi:hypothetical protein